MSRHYQIIVVGAGAGGLVVAIGAAKAGKSVLLIEKGTYGGDCTNFGCIPSKALIASAEAAYMMKQGEELGVEGSFLNGDRALERVRRIIEEVRSHEDPIALKNLGVETVTGIASFQNAQIVQVGDEVFTADQFVLATGSIPLIPPIQGLEQTPYLTNETVFDLEKIPKRLCVIGGGPIGCELGQAFSRLGSEVYQVHRGANLLKKEEPEAQATIAQKFQEEGIQLFLGYRPQSVHYHNSVFTLSIQSEQRVKEIQADALLVAVGRVANVSSLNLAAAGVECTEQGIDVDRFGRTSQKHIWAVGDVTGGPLFTHSAENQARTVLTSLLLPFKKKMSRESVPRVTYTDPEVASFGLLESEACARYGESGIATYMVPMKENDRAVTAGRTEGFVKVVTKKMSSHILGTTIVGPRAGEMLPELSLAAKEKVPLRKVASLIHPYPTYSLAIRRAGDFWLTQTLLPWLRHPLKGLRWKRFLPLLFIVILMGVAYALGAHKYLTFEMLQRHHQAIKGFLGAHPVITPILFTLIYAVATSLSLPGGAILSLIGGFLFPIPWSTLYVLVGATVGASVIFLAAKSAFGEVLRRKAGPFVQKMEKGFQKNAWSYLLFLRFVPLFPFWLVNIAPALFNVRFVTYAWTTFVGIIPGAYVFTQAGAGLGAIFEQGKRFSLGALFNWQLRVALIALALFALVPIMIKKWIARRKKS